MKDERLAWAEATLRQAGRMALRYFADGVRVERKPDRSPVTIADRAIETFLRRQLERAFPGEPIVGEEFGAPRGHPTSYWTIDPIDGTRAFLRGLPSWGILVGRVERNHPVLGACDFPCFQTFLGVGHRTPAYERHRGTLIRLGSAQPPPSLSKAVVFHGGRRWWLGTRYAKGFDRLVRQCFLERAYGDCYGYLWLFRGGVDAILDYGVKRWDMVPLAALAAATGRVLTDFSGRPNFTGPESILAHPRLTRLIVHTLGTRATG